MQSRLIRVALFASLATLVAAPAEAHERREAGPLTIVVGWGDEPAYADSINAVQVRVSRDDEPVENARLRVVVRFGDSQRAPLALEPVFGSPGEYRAAIVPTRAGTYVFHVTGRAGGRRIDERFQSGDDTFEDVSNPNEIEFPADDPSRGELGDRAKRTETRLGEVRAAAVARADDAARSGMIGMILGAVGVLLGLAALVVANRNRTATE